MKRTVSLILCLLLLLNIGICTSAASAYVVDNAQLLSQDEIRQIEEVCDAIHQQYGMDVVILTVDSLNGNSAQAAADDYYDYSGYSEDGVLFLLAMAEREWYISTSGKAIYALTDYGLYQLEEAFLPYLQDGNYFGAFATYVNETVNYIASYQSGNTVDGYVPEDEQYTNHTDVVYEEESGSIGGSILLGCLIGLIVAAISVFIMRSAMNTKRAQHAAGDYLKSGSYNLYTKRDVFLYSQVTKTPCPQENSSTRSGGGGSGVHTGSSGRSHGGRGGKF